MVHGKVRLLAVTGGIGVVREAMKSGKRAVCAGPGNPPVVVDETADIMQAGRDVVRGGAFDNNLVCVTEKTCIVVETMIDDLVASITRHGGYLVSSWQLRRLLKSILAEDRGPGTYSLMNREFIGQNASVLLKEIGVNVGDEVRQIVAVVEPDHQLVWSEQMMPVMPVVPVPNVEVGIELAVASEHGFGHTAVMHSKNVDHMTRMARVMDCSIFVKNGPSLAGLGWGGEGYTSFTISTPTGEGLTTCRSFSRLRRCSLFDGFRIV
jgi:acyl-CoA reductase-like NAD-dependent aldehyde dehydrogenase